MPYVTLLCICVGGNGRTLPTVCLWSNHHPKWLPHCIVVQNHSLSLLITNFPNFCRCFAAILSIFLQPFRVWLWYHFSQNLLTRYVPTDICSKCLILSDLQYDTRLQISVVVYVAVVTCFISCRQLTGLQILAAESYYWFW